MHYGVNEIMGMLLLLNILLNLTMSILCTVEEYAKNGFFLRILLCHLKYPGHFPFWQLIVCLLICDKFVCFVVFLCISAVEIYVSGD